MNHNSRLLAPTHRLIAAAFLMDFCVAMVGLANQNLGVHILDAPNIVLGLFATLGAFAYTVGCLFSGSLSDRIGRRRCAVAACLGCGVAWLLIPNVGAWKWVLCVVPLSGASLSLFWPSVQAWLSELSGGGRRELSRNLGRFNVLWCVGLMLGPVATGYLWGVEHRLAFYVPAALLIAVVAIVLSTPRAAPRADDITQADNASHENAEFFLKLAWVGNFASWFAGGVVGAMFPKLGYSLGLSAPQVGWMIFALRLGQVLMFIAASYEQRWQYKLWPMMLLQIAGAGGMLVAAAAQSVSLFAAGFAVAGLCAGMTYTASLFYTLHGREHGKGRTSGFHEAVLGSGVFLGPLIGGLGAQFINLRAPFVIAAGVFMMACVAQLWMRASAGARCRRQVGEDG